MASGQSPDCNRNGVPDSCDLAQGTSADRGGDGIPDECQAPFSGLFLLGFEGCPERIQGAPGEEKTLEIYPTLTVRDNSSPDGPGGWLLSIAVEGGVVESIVYGGIHVSTVFDQDGDPTTPPLNPYDLDLKDAGFQVVGNTAGEAPGPSPADFRGVYVVFVLHTTSKMVLQPNGVSRLAKISMKVRVPPLGQPPNALRLRYRDGLRAGGETVSNVVLWGSTSWSCLVRSCAIPISAAQPFLRCDANDDLRVDIADPIWILNELFGGGEEPQTRCRFASDCNGDGTNDISDAISALAFLLSGGRAPPPPFPACGTGDGTESCEPGTSACLSSAGAGP